MAWLVCVLFGLLFIGAAVTWGMMGPALDQLSLVMNGLLTIAWGVFLGSALRWED